MIYTAHATGKNFIRLCRIVEDTAKLMCMGVAYKYKGMKMEDTGVFFKPFFI